MAKKVSAAAFANFLTERCAKKDGYIMGATGQNPKKWTTGSWWFTQYSGDQRNKALYWRENAERVWDCNGLSEGYYKDMTGVDINTKARYNYSGWCSPKGTGKIPNDKKVPGAAVFIHSSSSGYITHVGYQEKPVDSNNPNGDWYVIEARGVMYGVVRTKLNSRGWNRWGWMTKYFDYSGSATSPTTPVNDTPQTLKKGMSGSDVKTMQKALMAAGYDLGKWGADGDYGSDTEKAVRAFQKDKGLEADGICGPKTWTALLAPGQVEPAGPAEDEGVAEPVESGEPIEPEEPEKDTNYYVRVTGGTVNVRTKPDTGSKIVCVVKKGDMLAYAGTTSADGWHNVVCEGQSAWISGKYAEVKAIDGEVPPGAVIEDDSRAIIDISAYQTIKDAAAAAKIAKNVKLVIHRASVGSNKDTKWAKHAGLMRDAGIAYGVYHYVKAKTAAAAREEAQLFWKQASPYNPIFYAADMEWSGIPSGKARAVCSAFIAELKRLGARKTGIYVGHHLYKLWNLNYGEVDFVWIPRYGSNKTNLAGKPGKWPAYPCTLHQYTSCGSIPGVTGRVDMNRLTGKGLTFKQQVE